MVDRRRWEEMRKARLPRPSNIPTTVWSKMGYLQRYNLSNGLLIWDRRTKTCKRSLLAESTGSYMAMANIGLDWPDIPKELEYVPSVSDPYKNLKSGQIIKSLEQKRLQKKKKKKKVTKKKLSTHHRSIDPLVMVSGSGSFRLSDKSTYVGEMKNGLLHGNGIRSWKDKSKYTGGWKNGERNGQGSMVYSTGEEYIGLWKNDTKTGRGTMFRKNGSLFIADWKNNLVVTPYTKKSSNEQAYDVYKVYLKLGMENDTGPGKYKKVSGILGIGEEQARKLVARYKQLIRSSEVEKPQGKNPFPSFNLTSKRKEFVTATEKLFGRVAVITRKMIIEVLDKNPHFSWPGWAVDTSLTTSTKGHYYFPDNKGNFNLETKVEKQLKQKRSIGSSSIEKLELTPKTLKILKSNGIYTIRELTRRTEADLLEIPTLSKSVIKELKKGLKELGLELISVQYSKGGSDGSLRYRQI